MFILLINCKYFHSLIIFYLSLLTNSCVNFCVSSLEESYLVSVKTCKGNGGGMPGTGNMILFLLHLNIPGSKI